MANNVSSNYQKYHSKNPIQIYLIKRFIHTLQSLIVSTNPRSILDAGCGEGILLSWLQKVLPKINLVGIDISNEALRVARRVSSGVKYQNMDVCKLDYPRDSFDLIIMSEVLEHLSNPEVAVKEAKRVSNEWCLFSVPNEPIFSLFSLLSGRYINRFGRHPEHLHFWSPQSFYRFIKPHFAGIRLVKSLPWTIVLAKKR